MDAQAITITTKGGELRERPAKRGDRGSKPWQYFAWHCTLEYRDRKLEVPDYKAGTAHCERKVKEAFYSKSIGSGWIRATEEQAKALHPYGSRLTVHDAEWTWYRPTPPTAFDVLYGIVSDANCYERASDFEGFCGDLGYDSDSRTAESVYKACGEVSKRLRTFLGMELFARVLAMDEDELKAWCEGRDLLTPTQTEATLRGLQGLAQELQAMGSPEPTPAPDAYGEALDATPKGTALPDAPSERAGGPRASLTDSEPGTFVVQVGDAVTPPIPFGASHVEIVAAHRAADIEGGQR